MPDLILIKFLACAALGTTLSMSMLMFAVTKRKPGRWLMWFTVFSIYTGAFAAVGLLKLLL